MGESTADAIKVVIEPDRLIQQLTRRLIQIEPVGAGVDENTAARQVP